MLWYQVGLSFLIWIGYGVLQGRRSQLIRTKVALLNRPLRGILGAALFVVGAMVLIGGLGIVLQGGGFTRAGLTPLAWFGASVLGLGFVHAQTMGMAMLVSLVQDGVTNEQGATSINTVPGNRRQP